MIESRTRSSDTHNVNHLFKNIKIFWNDFFSFNLAEIKDGTNEYYKETDISGNSQIIKIFEVY